MGGFASHQPVEIDGRHAPPRCAITATAQVDDVDGLDFPTTCVCVADVASRFADSRGRARGAGGGRLDLGSRFGGRLDVDLRFNRRWCPDVIRRDPAGQHFRDVLRFAVGEVLDLLPAGDAGDGDACLLTRGVDGREKTFFADLARDLVVLGLVTERTCHSTAARAAFGHLATCGLQDRH
jgi:hypothetical protein